MLKVLKKIFSLLNKKLFLSKILVTNATLMFDVVEIPRSHIISECLICRDCYIHWVSFCSFQFIRGHCSDNVSQFTLSVFHLFCDKKVVICLFHITPPQNVRPKAFFECMTKYVFLKLCIVSMFAISCWVNVLNLVLQLVVRCLC